jgi:dolichyl-diphosphooligosaccharide--protein glycosyltransferase
MALSYEVKARYASLLTHALLYVAFCCALYFAGKEAYGIRLYAIKTYGRVIHEFDPWFNMRATKYLADNGWTKFFTWFDYESWYPLGRPVGTTIYPGMQITSVTIWKAMKLLLDKKNSMSLNDVCVYVPAWFGVSATCFLALLTKECTGSYASGAVAGAIMSIVPAHLMRSVGGGYDNESIALTAMCATFFCWTRSLRADPQVKDGRPTRDSVVWGVLCGLAYVYMVAAWGGFIFVVNMIGAHAALLFFLGRYTSNLHRAYSLFYIIGTMGAMRVPVVGWGPLKSTEQIAPLLVFFAFQILEYCEVQRRARALSFLRLTLLRIKVTIPVLLVGVGVAAFLQMQYNYFGPPSARVRGLFVKHTRTGNPLVDSVAEHQPANEQAYQQYLHNVYDLAYAGFGVSCLSVVTTWTDSSTFLVLYALIAYYFSNRMARLVILLGPVASALGGVAIGFCVDQFVLHPVGLILKVLLVGNGPIETPEAAKQEEGTEEASADDKGPKGNKKGSAVPLSKSRKLEEHIKSSASRIATSASTIYNSWFVCLLRIAVGVCLIRQTQWPIQKKSKEFYKYAHELSEQLSQPSIMFKARLTNGKEIMLDDYREAYWWLKKTTPQDARVMAWWDYGYQIAGIANRTTIADGNTWNHEHIATLGRILSGAEEKAHRVARHLADYVLVWAGGGGDDLAKSPHMARIGNSVYHDICPGDPTCSQFGFYQGGYPTPMMERCLLYKMVRYGEPSIPALNKKLFTHAFTSKYGKVRIFKIMNVSLKSKKWVADPANRVCDAPGSWYCTGQYPPALASLIAKRKAFRQLEDFNVAKDEESDEYVKEYHKRMEQRGGRGGDYGEDDFGGDMGGGAAAADQLGIQPYGCFGSESSLGSDKIYSGGRTGASLVESLKFAALKKKRFVAIARGSSVDGHAFAFDNTPKSSKAIDMDDGCDMPCLDAEQFSCGCADDVCKAAGVNAAKGETNARRWLVYEVPPEMGMMIEQEKRAAAKKRKAKGAKKRQSKTEL